MAQITRLLLQLEISSNFWCT